METTTIVTQETKKREVPPRRERISIICDVLAALKEDSLKLTHLLYKSNLPYSRLKQLLRGLMANGMVEEKLTADGVVYRITPQGENFRLECVHAHKHFKSMGF